MAYKGGIMVYGDDIAASKVRIKGGNLVLS